MFTYNSYNSCAEKDDGCQTQSHGDCTFNACNCTTKSWCRKNNYGCGSCNYSIPSPLSITGKCPEFPNLIYNITNCP